MPVPTTWPLAYHVTSNKFCDAAINATEVALPGQIVGLDTCAVGTVDTEETVIFLSKLKHADVTLTK